MSHHITWCSTTATIIHPWWRPWLDMHHGCRCLSILKSRLI